MPLAESNYSAALPLSYFPKWARSIFTKEIKELPLPNVLVFNNNLFECASPFSMYFYFIR